MSEDGMEWVLFIPIVLSMVCSGLAGTLWMLKYANPFYRSVATVLALTGLIGLGDSLTILDAERALLWRNLVIFGELFQPAALLYVSVALFDPLKPGSRVSILWRARAVTGVGIISSLLVCGEMVFSGLSVSGGGFALAAPQMAGRVMSSFSIIALVVGVAYLEQSMRAMRDPLRYQLKFILIGLGALAVVQIYRVSQPLVTSVPEAHAALLTSLGSLVAVSLVAFGLARARLRETMAAIYVSPGVLSGSVTFLVVGLYLLAVGLVGELIRYSGLPLSDVLSRLAVFVAAIALVVVLASRSVRARMNRWIARRFYHAKYDYRAKWLEVTDAFQACHTAGAVLDQLLEILSRTFSAPRISIWIRYESDRQFHLVRSINGERSAVPMSDAHPVVTRLRGNDEPVDTDAVATSPGEAPDPFQVVTQAALCVPIHAADQLIGFIALSLDEQGERYRDDDRMLLRAIAHHVSMLLVLARHTEERRAAVGLEALHRFSAFCLHDLKNLTAGLSLVLQNAEVHGHDPAFQQSAMRTVAGTVKRMMHLMEKLSLRTQPEAPAERLDLGSLIRDTVQSLNLSARVDMRALGSRPLPVRAVREELQQVFINLLLNARQAAGEQGRVSLTAEVLEPIVTVRITDDGPGIPPDRLQTLFQPFQTTKPGGLGIGLYECKRILESHQGSIRVLSEAREGTTIYIELPIMTEAPQPCGRADQASRAQEGSGHE